MAQPASPPLNGPNPWFEGSPPLQEHQLPQSTFETREIETPLKDHWRDTTATPGGGEDHSQVDEAPRNVFLTRDEEMERRLGFAVIDLQRIAIEMGRGYEEVDNELQVVQRLVRGTGTADQQQKVYHFGLVSELLDILRWKFSQDEGTALTGHPDLKTALNIMRQQHNIYCTRYEQTLRQITSMLSEQYDYRDEIHHFADLDILVTVRNLAVASAEKLSSMIEPYPWMGPLVLSIFDVAVVLFSGTLSQQAQVCWTGAWVLEGASVDPVAFVVGSGFIKLLCMYLTGSSGPWAQLGLILGLTLVEAFVRIGWFLEAFEVPVKDMPM